MTEIFFSDILVPLQLTQKKNDKSEVSTHKITLDSINKTDIDSRETLLGNILVVGGNSLLPGYIERFEKCLYQIAPQTARIKVYSSPKPFDRTFASWIGESVLGSTGCFQNLWISKREYEESGYSIVKRKCAGF